MATALIDSINIVDFQKTHHHVYMKEKINDLLKQQIPYDENHGLVTPKQLIGDALHQRVQAIDHESCEAGDEDTFYVCDLGEVYRQHMRWKMNLPRVKPFYGTSSYGTHI